MTGQKPSVFTPAVPTNLDTDFLPYTKNKTTTPIDRTMSLQELWDTINLLTTDSTPALTDKIPFFDSGDETNVTTIDALLKAINLLTALSDIDSGDFLLVYDASAGVVKKIDYKDLVVIPLIAAAGDETTTITTGTTKMTFRMPRAFTVVAVRASLTTASSSGNPTFDINENGTSILGDKLSIDANEKTSVTATTPPTITDAVIADDSEITVDFDAVGTGAKGPKITLIGYWT